MKSLILVLLVCVSLTQAFNPFGMFKKWKGEVEESMDSSDHQEHAQRFIDEVRKTTAHFENSDHHRNKVGKVWMKFKNKAEETLENAKDTIDEVEEELNSNGEVPDRAKKVMKEIRLQTRGIVKSLKKIIHPIKFSREEPEEPQILPELPEPEVFTTELPEPEVFPTELPEPEVLSTELPEPEVFPTEPEVLPTEFLEATEEEPTEGAELQFTEEPEVLPTEPEVLPTELPEPEEPKTEEIAVEPTNEPEIEEEEGEKEIDDEEDVLGDEEDDDDEEEEPVQQEEEDDDEDEDDDDDNENPTEIPTMEPKKEKEVPEVVEVANRVEENMPKWLGKRQKKLRKLWEKYTLNNSEKVMEKIRKLQVSLARKTQD